MTAMDENLVDDVPQSVIPISSVCVIPELH